MSVFVYISLGDVSLPALCQFQDLAQARLLLENKKLRAELLELESEMVRKNRLHILVVVSQILKGAIFIFHVNMCQVLILCVNRM